MHRQPEICEHSQPSGYLIIGIWQLFHIRSNSAFIQSVLTYAIVSYMHFSNGMVLQHFICPHIFPPIDFIFIGWKTLPYQLSHKWGVCAFLNNFFYFRYTYIQIQIMHKMDFFYCGFNLVFILKGIHKFKYYVCQEYCFDFRSIDRFNFFYLIFRARCRINFGLYCLAIIT